MTKRMRELQAQILQKSKEAQGLTEGENVTAENITKAAGLMDEIDALQKEFETLERVEKSKKAAEEVAPVVEEAPVEEAPVEEAPAAEEAAAE